MKDFLSSVTALQLSRIYFKDSLCKGTHTRHKWGLTLHHQRWQARTMDFHPFDPCKVDPSLFLVHEPQCTKDFLLENWGR